jgi:uncharacterized membrane protein
MRKGPVSIRVKRNVVALALVSGAALTYFILSGTIWAIYATVCVAYTIVIFGMAWANGKWKLYLGTHSRGVSRLLQIHIGCVLAAILIVWLAIWLNPMMPEWLVSRGGDRWSWYQVLVIVLLVGVVLMEQHWIEKSDKTSSN